MEDARKEVSQLEKLISQSGASPGVTVALAEYMKGGGPKAARVRGYEGIDAVAKSIFKGKAPTIATTWKIIFAILAFVGALSALFFALWYVQIKGREKAEKK